MQMNADIPSQASRINVFSQFNKLGAQRPHGGDASFYGRINLRLLFPFARNVLADATREGGFMPVLLTPIDFVALWQSRRAQAGQPPVGNA